MDYSVPNTNFALQFETAPSFLARPELIRCIYGCQKWIPDKILHRNSNSIFFSIFFSRKNIFELSLSSENNRLKNDHILVENGPNFRKFGPIS